MLKIDKGINRVVLIEFIKSLNEIYKAIEYTKGIKFTSSSLLMVYDSYKGEPIVKLIDFENAKETEEEDKDLLEGICNLCGILKQIHDDA